MTDIAGMFGISPDQIRIQRMQQMMQQNAQVAQMNPFDRANYAMMNAGGMLVQGGAQMAGLKTREEQVAEGRQQIGQMVADGSAKSYLEAAKKANEMGDPQAAQALYQKSQELEQAGVDQSYKKAQTSLAEAREEALSDENRRAGVRPVPISGTMLQNYKVDAAGNLTGETEGTPYQNPAYLKTQANAEGMKDSDRLKFKIQHQKDFVGANSVINSSNDVNKKIENITTSPEFGYMFGGYTEKYASKLGTQRVADLNQKVESLKSNLRKVGLDMYRQGGGIGSMTVQEWPMMETVIESIDPKMSEQGAKEALARVTDWVIRAKKEAGEIYRDSWEGEKGFYQPRLYANSSKGLDINQAQKPVSPPTSTGVRKYNPATGKIE